jgi:formylglycine-generating enzyme required for sulfatase activity
MKRINGGPYVPLYRGAFEPPLQDVPTFYLAERPVTNAEFLAFVRANPQWRRSEVKRVFANARYLANWTGDVQLGPDAPADEAVVYVSWFAARAYAGWKGMRLPTTAEWERAAAAGRTTPYGHREAGFREEVLRRYSRGSAGARASAGAATGNYWGIYDLHGTVWEWVEDFNANLVTGESRNNTDLDRDLFCGSASLGASDVEDYGAFLRFALRSGLEAAYTGARLGFRLAADAPIAWN